MKKAFIFTILLVLILPFVYAAPSQVTSTISLNPYYLPSLTANTNYTFSFSINPVDRYTQTLSAIVKFQNYMTPAITYNLWVDGKTCSPISHTISTTYSNSQQAELSFDCSQIINHTGNYTAKLQTNKNAGSITATLIHNYINDAQGKVAVFGTEYVSGNPAKVWLQLLNSTNDAITNAICYVDIYTPQNEEYIERAEMTNMFHDGIYYYDLIAPIVQGVYPVIATCYYQASELINNATSYFTEFGTYNAGTIADTYIQDGNFLRFKETAVSPRNISVGLNFSDLNGCPSLNENFLTGINIHTYMKFSSSTNDDITISIYNHSSNTWIDLPNKHFESSSFTTTSNIINLNNLTKSGLYTTSKGINIRFRDTQITDGTTSNLDIDHAYVGCLALANPSWTEIKGSSEIHINPSTLGYNFGVNTLCNLDDLSNGCSVFYQNTSVLNEPQGLIQENITINNLAFIPLSEHIHYQTGSTIDCSAIISVEEHRLNGTSYDITNEVLYGAGDGLDNCNLQIPINLDFNETSYQIEIISENYALWETQRANDIIKVMNTSSSNFCYALNYTYLIPINQTLIGDDFNIFCNRILDDLYWYDTLVRNEAPLTTTMGDFESIIIEERFYYPEIVEAYLFIEAEKRRATQQETFNLSQDILYLVNQSQNQTQDLINIQTANILSAISASTNLSTLEINLLNATINSQLTALSNQLNSNTTQTQALINSQVNIILNTLDYYHNLTTAEINSLNSTMTTQYNNLLANQNTLISISNQINATTIANQLALQNILSQLNATSNQIQYLNSTLIQVLNQTQTNENWLINIWNYITGYLTNQSIIINEKLDLLLNASNITTTSINIAVTQNPCITGSQWVLTAQTSGYYGEPLTNTQANCTIYTTEWGTANMTYTPTGIWNYDQTCPNPVNWSWQVTCV